MLSIILDNIHAQGQLFRNLTRNPKFWLILITDVLAIVLAHYLAYMVRFEFYLIGPELRHFGEFIPLLLLVKIPCFYVFGLYRGMWRYTNLYDIINVFIVTLFASTIIISLLLFENRFQGLSRSVFILDFLFTFGLIAGHRAGIRYLYQRFNGTHHLSRTSRHQPKKRLLLIGAGDAAEKVLREMRDLPHLPYQAVGLLDDNPAKTGLKIYGIPVIGLVDDLETHILRTGAEELLITAVTLNARQMRRLVTLCRATQLPYKVLPSLGELIDNNVSIKAIRDISYKDLLGREEVYLDQHQIGAYLTGRTILITGAGGSIGSELCRQILRFSPGPIILLDSSEENLYRIQMELRHERENVTTVAVLGAVQNLRLLDTIFRQHLPQVVFHAAAYKHVPLVERNPWQAVHNNIIATRLLIEASILHGASRFVLVSTDKAVRPTNVMGATKRVTELLMLAYTAEHWDGHLSPAWQRTRRDTDPMAPQVSRNPCKHTTRFLGVRFGNVLGSSGSVIPLFKRQIEKGGPVTVTHPEVTRFFMSAEEAAQLILQAGSMGEGGEIFILKMGAPVKIADMARELIKLTGREPDRDIEIRYTGLRAGEKLYEELITAGEGIIRTHHKKIMVLKGNHIFSCTELNHQLDILSHKSKDLDSQGIKETLHRIVPEYVPDYTID